MKATLIRLLEWLTGENIGRLRESLQVTDNDSACLAANLKAAVRRADAAEAEVAALKKDYPGGDQAGQAIAWAAVWRTLEDAGISSFIEPGGTGRTRAVGFIKHLAAERDRLKAELNERETNKREANKETNQQ